MLQTEPDPSTDTPQLVYARHDLVIMVQPVTMLVIIASVGLLTPEVRVAMDAAANEAGRRFFDTGEARELDAVTLHKLAGVVRNAWKQL